MGRWSPPGLTGRRAAGSVAGGRTADGACPSPRFRRSERVCTVRHRTRSAGWIACVVAACCAAFAPSTAVAQLVQIDEDLARAVSIGPSQRTQIDAFIERHREGLLSSDRTDVVNARQSLSDPLADARVSVAFRQAYSEALTDEIDALSGAEEPWRRLVGLRLAADVATQRTAAIVRAAVDAPEAEVRLFSMFAIETVFDTITRSSAAITDQTLAGLVDTLGEVIRETDDPRLADAAVRALGTAIQVPESRVAGLNTRAVRTLASSTSNMARRVDAVEATDVSALPLVRAGLLIRDYVAVTSVPRDAAMEAVGLGGDLIAFVFERVEARAAEGNREAEAMDIQLAGIGQALIFFGEQSRAAADRDRPRVEQVELVDPLRDADLANFRARALSLIGDDGALRRPPLSFPDDRFVRKG